MAEQQLIDYIKKAKAAGQSDDQSRVLLSKNGWTEQEVSDAFAEINQPAEEVLAQQPEQPQTQTQPQVEPQVAQNTVEETKIEIRQQPVVTKEPQAEPQNQPQPQAAQNNMQVLQKRNSHMVIKLVMVLIILVVLGGIGYFVAGQYVRLPWNPFRPSPETVISKMLINTKAITASHSLANGEISILGASNSSIAKFLLKTDTKANTADIGNPKVDSTFSLKLSLPGAASAGASLDADVIIIGKAVYFKINNIVVPANASLQAIDATQLNGKWIKIDSDSIGKLSQVNQTTLPNISQFDNLALSKNIQNLLLNVNMFSVSKELDDQAVGGQSAYHYLLTISKEKLESLVAKMITSAMQAQKTDNALAGSALSENVAQGVAKTFIDAIGDVSMEVWIGKKDFMLYEAKLDKKIDLSKILQASGMPADNIISAVASGAEIKFDVVNSDFGKAVVINEPAGAQKIEDIMLPVIKNQKIKSDLSQLGILAQSMFVANKSYYSLCSKTLINGAEKTLGNFLATIGNDISAQGATKLICLSGVSSYCVSAQLTDGSWLCVAKNGGTGKLECNSYKMVCQ